MLDRTEELSRIVETDVARQIGLKKSKLIPFEVMFVYSDIFGVYDQRSGWYNLKGFKGISDLASKYIHAYGYHIKTLDGTVFDFWFDGKNYELLGYKKGKNEKSFNPPKIFKSLIKP